MTDRETLVLDNQGLVISIASSYGHPRLREDLIQAGMEALVRAAGTYDPEKASFSTYVWQRIRTAMRSCMRDDHTIGLTELMHLNMRRVVASELALEGRNTPVTSELIAEQAGLDLDEVELVRQYKIPLSLDYEPDESWPVVTVGEYDDYSGMELRDVLSRIKPHLARAVAYPLLGIKDREMVVAEGASEGAIRQRRAQGLKELREHGRQN